MKDELRGLIRALEWDPRQDRRGGHVSDAKFAFTLAMYTKIEVAEHVIRRHNPTEGGRNAGSVWGSVGVAQPRKRCE